MEKFGPLDSSSVNERELKLVKYWQDIDLLHKSQENRKGNENFVFYEGPPTANGKPGIHHVFSRTLKDLTLRHQIMKGKYVTRKAGWDTHGLPVEIEVEKKLGLKNKKEIEAYGVEKFNKECKNSVFQYESLWRKMTERMAYEIDLDNPYVTFHNDYIESVWYILNKMYNDGLLYEGHKILPYCPRCGTGLASHEVAQGYENIKTVTCYVKFKRINAANEYFIAWTTTPWTLCSNVALAVHPRIIYVKLFLPELNEYWWMAETLISEVLTNVTDNYEIVDKKLGIELEGIDYEQLIPMLKADKKAFYIVNADYVTTSDGTGIVHIAPAFGEDDYNVGKKYNLPVFNPVNEEGKYSTGFWKDMLVFDADTKVIEYLKENGKLVKKQKMEHNYPHCWRCHTPLIYYAKPSWYINVNKFKDQMIKNNNGVKWFPDYVGEKRFGNWLENLNDWALSRNRYWGTPLPIWKCEKCGKTTSIGSKKELIERAIEDIDENIDLHRPYVDDCHLKCECGGIMTRYKDVIDVWFDSGAMPFAQRHYPFEHKNDFDNYFPADFICEGIDQTRGWFYSLLAISTYMTGKAPYKRVLVNDLVLDKNGKKMSKSKGNTVDPFEIFEKFGADVARFYVIYVSDPWLPTKFDIDGLKEVESKYIRTLRNIYTFFQLYVKSEKIDPYNIDIPVEDREEIDKWIISRFNNLVKSVENNLNIFELTRISKDLIDFIVEDFSNWYIRRSRRRFWGEEGNSKSSAFVTTYEVLLGLSKLVAPITPFIAEELYRNLTAKESVHLEDYPVADLNLIDEKLEEKVNLVRDIVSLGRSAREKVNIKVRQPLESIVIDGKYRRIISDLEPLVKEELNIKVVDYESNVNEFMIFELKPNFKVAGPVLGKNIAEFTKYLQDSNKQELIEKLEKENIILNLGGEDYEINKTYVDIKVSAKEGYDVQVENNLYVLLNTKLTPELINEGYVRELISKIQQERKTKDLDVSDRIVLEISCEDALKSVFVSYADTIKYETLTTNIKFTELDEEATDLNDKKIQLRIIKEVANE